MLLGNWPYDIEFFYNFYVQFVAEALLYFRSFAFYIILWVLWYFCLCIVMYRRNTRQLRPGVLDILTERVLVVVAHPDDECMFFGPTIFRLCEQGADVQILCLSNGNFEEKGETRRTELWTACQALGVPLENIIIVMDSRLPDDPNAHWPVRVVSKVIQHYLESRNRDTLITFDRGGVSSHANHSALFLSVAYMFVEKLIPSGVTVYTLDSINILRKYSGFLDLPLSCMLSSRTYFARWSESRRIVRAMKCHRSQMVWFRYLYVIFSRYMVINTLTEIRLEDIELELDVGDE